MIYWEQRQTFLEINTQPTSPSIISEEATELVLQLTRAYVAALPVAVLVAAFGVWWITRKALHPLKEVAAATEQIDAKALNQRLPQPLVQDEIGWLVQVLNHAFDRLERSFEQATRFSSDILAAFSSLATFPIYHNAHVHRVIRPILCALRDFPWKK
jgi:HAMP domain-containing protein